MPNNDPSSPQAAEEAASLASQASHQAQAAPTALTPDETQATVTACRAELAQIKQRLAEEIAARHQAEADLQTAQTKLGQLETLFRPLFEHAIDAILLLEDGVFIDCNPATVTMMHCASKDKFLALHPAKVSPEFQPDGRLSFEKANEMMAIALQRGRHQFEWVHQRLNGEDFWVEVTLTRIAIDGRQLLQAIWREIGDRKAAELALAESETHYRNLLEQSAIGLALCQLDGQLIYANAAFCDIVGHTLADAIALTYWQLTPEKYADAEQRQLQSLQTTGRYGPYEKEYIHKNGQLIPVRLSGVIVEYQGQPFIWSSVEDISDRKAAELALTTSENQFRRLVEGGSDLIYMIDADGAFTYLSPQFTTLFGYEVADFLHQPFVPLIHPDDLPQLVASNQDLFTTGEKQTGLEFRIQRQDGTWRWVTCSNSPIKDTANQVIGFQGIARDVSDRKAIEQAQARLTAILDATSDFVGITDLQGGHLYMNAAGYRLFEIPLDENIIGIPVDNKIANWAKPLVLEVGIPTALRTGIWQGETAIATRSGREIPVSQVIIAHKAEDGTPEYLSTIVRDITAQKQTEAALQQNAQDLAAALQELQRTQLQMIQSEKMSSLGQLVAGVAHEINNPVSFIYGNTTHANHYVHDLLNLIDLYQSHYPEPPADIRDELDAMELEFLKEDLPKTLSSMRMGAERIRQIVNSLRTFSRLDESDCKDVDIHAGIDSALVILEHRLKRTTERPAIQVIKQYGDLPLVECYAGQLNQVLMNILTNAVDALEKRDRDQQAMPQSPKTIKIRTQVLKSEQISIHISDNGEGIPDEIKQRIFDPFFTTKPVGKGTGMGMSISHQIITENHGGTLQCFSNPGQDTEFVIQIPRRQRSVVQHSSRQSR